MPSTFDIGDVIRVTGTFTDTGGIVGDPTTVNLLYDTPTSVAPTTATRTSTSIGAVGGITKASTGVFEYDITTTGQGLYEWRYTSTGSLAASGESWFSVRPQRVTT
jgi:hypothetical protein